MAGGMTAGIAGMTGDETAGTIDGTAEMTDGIAEMTGGTEGKSRRAIATDWIGDSETLARTGGSTPITPAIIAMATVITAKDFAEATLRASASTPTAGDSNERVSHRNRKTSALKKPPT